MKIDNLQQINLFAELLEYQKETGILYWKKSKKEAGFIDKHGYRIITIKKIAYSAHRIAWALHHGEISTMEIDHINGIKHDNRIANLRLCSRSQNMWNIKKHKDNKSGYKGVYFHKKNQKWTASIQANKQRVRLGYFDSALEAFDAYKNSALKLHGQFANPSLKR